MSINAVSSSLTKTPALLRADTVRLMLVNNEVVSVGIRSGQDVIRVVSGRAWITHEGTDTILYAGEQQRLSRGQHNAVIASVDGQPVVVEVLLSQAA